MNEDPPDQPDQPDPPDPLGPSKHLDGRAACGGHQHDGGINCERFSSFMRAFRDDELPSEVRAAFSAHIEACPPCVDYLDGYQRSIDVAKKCCQPSAHPGPPPEGLVAAILSATSVADADEP